MKNDLSQMEFAETAARKSVASFPQPGVDRDQNQNKHTT